VVPKIIDFISFGQKGVKLAISINGSNDLVRQAVMPINRRYNMQTLHEAIKKFTQDTQSQILAEYVLMKGVNDALDHAKELAVYLQSIPCIINLIPYNAQSQDRFAPSEHDDIKLFQKYLIEAGFKTYVRQNKGSHIMAACGQLGQLHLKKSLLQKGNSF
jgi:23S rRNA (adenine2503-C2)-methyltransferase